MALPVPVSGLVIRYGYLWHDEHKAGKTSGRKDRPCAIILSVKNDPGGHIVTVLPITHAPPVRAEDAIEIPAAAKSRLKLDQHRSWIVLTEANRFIWPGPDLKSAVSGKIGVLAFGLLPKVFYNDLKHAFVAKLKQHGVGVVRREG